MADIELVIKIDKASYDTIKDMVDIGLGTGDTAIAKGTPLPKGHGKIIDANIIKDFKNRIKHYGKDYRFTQEEILNILERYEIKYAPTIIEADKEGDE